jgi:hypothetical protein
MRRRQPLGIAMITALMLLPSGVGRACDICAVYMATELQERHPGLRLGVAEQFSRFTTLQRDGDEVANPSNERMESSITQVLVGYAVHPRLSAQVNLPIISRSYRRIEGSNVVSGDESGIGDLSLVGSLLGYSRMNETSLTRVSLLLGVKLPSGDPRRLREELPGSADDHGIPPIFSTTQRIRLHHDPGGDAQPSGVHGHDLALGSGSTDVLVGGQVLSTYQRLYASALLQYALRTAGSFGYRYANELTFSGGPGVFALLEHDRSLGAQLVLTAETKGKDRLHARPLDDTAITSLYLGPGFHLTWGARLSADLAADLPVIQNNSALQIVPDFRLRGGILWRF